MTNEQGRVNLTSAIKHCYYYRPRVIKCYFNGRVHMKKVEEINGMDYKADVNGVVNPYHANMLKQYVERQNVASHCLMSAETTASVFEDDDTELFSLDDCAFPTAKQPESYNDVSISETLNSPQSRIQDIV